MGGIFLSVLQAVGFAAGLFICCSCIGLSGQPLLADCAGACMLVFVHVLLVVFDDRNILRLLNGTNGISSMRVAVGCYDCLECCVTFNNVNFEFSEFIEPVICW